MVLRLITLVIAGTPFLSSAQSQQDTIDSLVAVNRRLTDQLRLQADRAELNRQVALINADSARAAAMRAEMNAQRVVAAEQLAKEKYQQFAQVDSRQKAMLALYIDSTAYYRFRIYQQFVLVTREMYRLKLHNENLKWEERKRLDMLDDTAPEPIELKQFQDSVDIYSTKSEMMLNRIDSLQSRIDSTLLLLKN